MAEPAITVDSPIRIDQGCKRKIPGLLSHFHLSSPELYCQYGDKQTLMGCGSAWTSLIHSVMKTAVLCIIALPEPGWRTEIREGRDDVPRRGRDRGLRARGSADE